MSSCRYHRSKVATELRPTCQPGDSTPVTAADFAIQGLVSRALKQRRLGYEGGGQPASNHEMIVILGKNHRENDGFMGFDGIYNNSTHNNDNITYLM